MSDGLDDVVAAHTVLSEVDGMHSELEELSGCLRGEVRIGGMYPTGPYDLAEMLATPPNTYSLPPITWAIWSLPGRGRTARLPAQVSVAMS